MTLSSPLPASWSPRLLSMLRIVAAFLFIAHGTQKLFGTPSLGPGGPGGHPPLLSLFGVAGTLETFGGLLLLLGLFTRPVAFVLAGEMAVAYFLQHAPQGLLPFVNRGELAVLYCFLYLYLAAAGGGPWSLDALRRGGGSPPGTTP
jgi:putative oxidoreductase